MTTFVSAGELEAAIGASDIEAVGMSRITVSNPLTAGGISAASTFFTGSSGGTGFAQVVLNQESNDLVYDQAHEVIYLSVPGKSSTYGNTIAVLDLGTASIKRSMFAGSEPDVLAISDNSQFLYAGIDGSGSVQRFKLPSLQTDINYYLNADPYSAPYFALDLQVAPAAPYTTAVTVANMGLYGATGDITIFDDARPRPIRAPGESSRHFFDTLQWGSNATVLFSADTQDSDEDFYTLSISSKGAVLQHDYPGVVNGAFSRIHFDAGTKLVYTDSGRAINPADGRIVGTFADTGVMVPDSAINKAFFVYGPSNSATVESFNLTHFNIIGSINLSYLPVPLRLVRWGQNGLAFNTNDGHVYLIGGNFVH